jgi:hypothetical protein
VLLSSLSNSGKVAPAQASGSRDNGAILDRELEIKLGTDRVKVRHGMIVVVDSDLDRPDYKLSLA